MEQEIVEIINRETRAWDIKDVDLLLSIFHEDMVWPWPADNTAHDPIYWELPLGKFNYNRWKGFYTVFFNENELLRNHRETIKIIISSEGDGAFAVVDIDTLWQRIDTKKQNHWFGRVSKTYAKVGKEWKLTMHTGVLKY